MRSDCPLNYGLEIFGDKWTLLIIRDLMFFGKRYYNEFLSSNEGISTTVLADRLALLEKQKIIKKQKDPEHKQKIVYSLTQKGIDLLPIIINIGMWSSTYSKKVSDKMECYFADIRKNFEKGIAALKAELSATHLE